MILDVFVDTKMAAEVCRNTWWISLKSPFGIS